MSEPRTRRELQRDGTRQRIFTAAVDVFRRDGVDDARIEDIVAAAGVSRGSFYFHFPTKEDVLAAAYQDANARLVALVAVAPASTPIVELLRSVVADVGEVWAGDPVMFGHVGLHALRQVARTDPAGPRDPVRVALAERFEAAIQRNELLSSLPAALLADIFLLNAFTGLLAWSANPGLPLAPVLEGVVHLFLAGAARAP